RQKRRRTADGHEPDGCTHRQPSEEVSQGGATRTGPDGRVHPHVGTLRCVTASGTRRLKARPGTLRQLNLVKLRPGLSEVTSCPAEAGTHARPCRFACSPG